MDRVYSTLKKNNFSLSQIPRMKAKVGLGPDTVTQASQDCSCRRVYLELLRPALLVCRSDLDHWETAAAPLQGGLPVAGGAPRQPSRLRLPQVSSPIPVPIPVVSFSFPF